MKSQAQCWRGFKTQARQEIFLPESPFSADSLTVSAQLPRAAACINICIHVKNPNIGSHTIVRTDENTTHTLTGMGSAALAAAVLCAAKTTRSIRKDSNNEVLKWKCILWALTMMMSWCLMSSDVSWHIRDKLWPMPKHGSVILYVHGNQKAR